MKFKKTAVPLILRAAVFLCIFFLYSGTIGPRIISSPIQNTDGFWIYGTLGKTLLFGLIALALLIRRKGKMLQLDKWNTANAAWLVLSGVSFAGTWLIVGNLLVGQSSSINVILAHLGLICSVLFALVGSLGLRDLIKLGKFYKTELLISAVLAAGFYGFLMLVYGSWQILASTVLDAVSWLLRAVGLKVSVIPPRTLLLSKFGVDVAQYCSGIESIALFTGLYVIVSVLDWTKLNHKRLIAMFLPALLVLFALNILRVFGLILGGYYINPQVAFSLFHTYAGMLFFILYSAIFWALSYKWMLHNHGDAS